ncbi:sensor histidine kinase [Paenibacillus sp. NFR01]|uniref:sensor histidine kinase n=1 Tax=Paenibacillus sp. NFR01 TaxID=1566279 RepID=UPI0008B8222C|nr:sensor histidine kinase [Paenibacillus sp. NFR01]SEU26191.1 two-component system, sensor histidine kinase YesM [Paenibacillus sp. NFR01]
MEKWLRKLRDQSLFSKIFVVMMISIILVTVLIAGITVQMSQKLFVQTFSITNGKIINQIKSALDSSHYAAVNIAIDVAQSGAIRSFMTEQDATSLANFKRYFSMRDQMDRIQSGIGAKNIGISILGANGRSYTSDVTYWSGSSEQLKNIPITASAAERGGQLFYSFMDASPLNSQSRYLVAAKALVVPGTSKIYGTLYMFTRETDFRQNYASFTSQGNDVVILDQSGRVVSSNRTDQIGTTSPVLLDSARQMTESNQASQELTLDGRDVIVLADYLPSYNFYIVNLIDKNETIGKLLDKKAIFLIVAAIAAVAVLVIYFLTKKLTQSLRTLVKKMSNVTQKNFHNYMSVTGTYETRQLSTAFNYMLKELNDYVGQLVETQKEQRKAELAALQQQINPHFLYNTLASVNILVQRGSKEQATETIHALISLLQNTISNVNETITVEEELINLRHYVYINQVRYGDRIKVDYFISPDCMSVQVPKLMLQPFIENAFFHAFNIKNAGYIYVTIMKDRDTLHCEVVDTGDGMDLDNPEVIPAPSGSRQLFSGIGIRNVHDRLTLLYGEEYGVTISSTPGQGTKVQIRIPC